MRPIRLLVADDHELVRSGLCRVLDRQSHFEVVGEAGNGRQTLELVRSSRVDVVLLDVCMPEPNGLEVAAILRRDYPQTRTLVVSMYTEQEYIDKARLAGARGYVFKGSGFDELVKAIHLVHDGGTCFPQDSDGRIARRTDGYERDSLASVQARSRVLTQRQNEVLRYTSQGVSTGEIARALGISPKTIATHRRDIMERLGIDNLADLVRYALRMEEVEPERGA